MLNAEFIKVKVKKEKLIVIGGLVMEEKIMEIPLAVVPVIDFPAEVKLLVINALIKKDRLDVILEMKGVSTVVVESPKNKDLKPASWEEAK